MGAPKVASATGYILPARLISTPQIQYSKK